MPVRTRSAVDLLSPPSNSVHRSDSLRSETSDASNKRVSFRQDVKVKQFPQQQANSKPKNVRSTDPRLLAVVDGDPNAADVRGGNWGGDISPVEARREAQKILEHMDRITCMASPSPPPFPDTRSLDRPSRRNRRERTAAERPQNISPNYSHSTHTQTLPSAGNTRSNKAKRDAPDGQDARPSPTGFDGDIRRRRKNWDTYQDSAMPELVVDDHFTVPNSKKSHMTESNPEPLQSSIVPRIVKHLDSVSETRPRVPMMGPPPLIEPSVGLGRAHNGNRPFSYLSPDPPNVVSNSSSSPTLHQQQQQQQRETTPPTNDLRAPLEVLYAQVVLGDGGGPKRTIHTPVRRQQQQNGLGNSAINVSRVSLNGDVGNNTSRISSSTSSPPKKYYFGAASPLNSTRLVRDAQRKREEHVTPTPPVRGQMSSTRLVREAGSGDAAAGNTNTNRRRKVKIVFRPNEEVGDDSVQVEDDLHTRYTEYRGKNAQVRNTSTLQNNKNSMLPPKKQTTPVSKTSSSSSRQPLTSTPVKSSSATSPPKQKSKGGLSTLLRRGRDKSEAASDNASDKDSRIQRQRAKFLSAFLPGQQQKSQQKVTVKKHYESTSGSGGGALKREASSASERNGRLERRKSGEYHAWSSPDETDVGNSRKTTAPIDHRSQDRTAQWIHHSVADLRSDVTLTHEKTTNVYPSRDAASSSRSRSLDRRTAAGATTRFFGDSDTESSQKKRLTNGKHMANGRTGSTLRRAASAAVPLDRGNSSSEEGSRRSRPSDAASQRSVFLHQAAVADIPPSALSTRARSRDELRASAIAGPPGKTQRRVKRSVSMISPWAPKPNFRKYGGSRELHYWSQQEDDRPQPHHQHRYRSASKDSQKSSGSAPSPEPDRRINNARVSSSSSSRYIANNNATEPKSRVNSAENQPKEAILARLFRRKRNREEHKREHKRI